MSILHAEPHRECFEDDKNGTIVGKTHQNAFTDSLLLAAHAFETDESAANKAERGVFWHLFAGRAGLSVIVLEDDIVVVRQLQETGRCPLRIVDQQGLRRRRQTPSNELILSPYYTLTQRRKPQDT